MEINIPWEKWTGTPWIKEGTIFLTKSGSHAYGTNIESSDLDIKGVAIPPKEYFFGFLNKFEQAESKSPDLTIFDIRKFFALAADANPNIIEFLFVDEKDWLVWSNWWFKIIDNRELFLSQKAKHTFSGYAVSQLNRIKTHKNWLLHPVENQPKRTDFGLPDGPTLEREQLKAFDSQVKKLEDTLGGKGWTKDKIEGQDEELVTTIAEKINLNKTLIPIILNERRYNSAMRNYASYQKWKTERNVTRSALEASFGYDTKHAMHLVRLMRMAKEILAEGKVLVKRPDAEDLLAIRRGAWSYDQLIDWAQKTEQELNTIISPLPHSPNRAKIDELLVDIVNEYLRDPD